MDAQLCTLPHSRLVDKFQNGWEGRNFLDWYTHSGVGNSMLSSIFVCSSRLNPRLRCAREKGDSSRVRLQPRAPTDAGSSVRRRPAARVRECGSHGLPAVGLQTADARSSSSRLVRAGETELTRCVRAGAVLPPFILFYFFLTWLLPFLCLYESPVYVREYN
jgi:hypothetical protein